MFSRLIIRLSSPTLKGSGRGYEPVAMIMFFALSIRLSTTTVSAASMEAVPEMVSTLFFFSRYSTPLVRRRTIRSDRFAAFSQLNFSDFGSRPSTPKSAAIPSLEKYLALSSIALEGMQPQLRHIPPTFFFSITAVFSPACPALIAAT